MTKIIRHVAGELLDGVQHCIVCGMMIVDYRDALFFPPPKEPLKGFDPGDVFTSELGLITHFTNVLPDGRTAEDCKAEKVGAYPGDHGPMMGAGY